MKLDLHHGSIVVISVEHLMEQPARIQFFEDIGQWVADNVYGKIDTVFMRQGMHLSEKKVLDNDAEGDRSYEQWLWIFEDPREAILFKMVWGNR
jgi:hypothetical protein